MPGSEIAMVGLGKMGGNMAERLVRGGHRVVVTDMSADAVSRLAGKGAVGATSMKDAVSKLKGPRAVWLMIPAGKPVDDAIGELAGMLSAGDIIIDGGNSNYRETIRRGKELAAKGIHYVDCGTSGGIWGLENGYSMMVGGAKEAVERLRPIFETLAPGAQTGWGHVGPSGAGHFVKMVHNGIEYGMMQAFAEGFAIMEKKKELDLNCTQIAEIWRNGSVVRSWLLDLAAKALSENPMLEGVKPWVSDSGEGRWTVQEAIDLDVSAPVITQSLFERFRSRESNSYADRMLAVLREQFGGHGVKRG
ncbi:MAG TPA: decarboxylating 6-phosphogluconate dehydrogenase [Phycisphaerales bacterium]|nr:decarboxylating 6-phosphogluconate dehydrogenase [Phycisphaerales bacterium]